MLRRNIVVGEIPYGRVCSFTYVTSSSEGNSQPIALPTCCAHCTRVRILADVRSAILDHVAHTFSHETQVKLYFKAIEQCLKSIYRKRKKNIIVKKFLPQIQSFYFNFVRFVIC